MDPRGRWAALLASAAADATTDDDGVPSADAAEWDGEVRDRTRHAYGQLRIADRLTAGIGREVAVATSGAGVVRGTLTDTAPDWLLVGDTLIPATAVVRVDGLGEAAERPGPVRRRLGLGYALRVLATDGAAVRITTTTGDTSHGPLDRVGADFVEQAGTTIPYAAIAAVRPT